MEEGKLKRESGRRRRGREKREKGKEKVREAGMARLQSKGGRP